MTARVSFTSRNGSSVDGALALPAGDGKAPAVVVIQEWWGLNDQIRATADRAAAEGFLALAPDLYHGRLAELGKPDEAQHLMNSLDWPIAIADIAGAVAHLREHPRCNGKVAVMGFCMGGALSLAAAAHIPGLSAVVPFYGVPGPQDWSKVTAPVQAHFCRTDGWATPAKGEEVQSAIRAHGGAMDLLVYDAQHAFMNEARPEVYAPEAAALAWKRAMDFLRAHG